MQIRIWVENKVPVMVKKPQNAKREEENSSQKAQGLVFAAIRQWKPLSNAFCSRENTL